MAVNLRKPVSLIKRTDIGRKIRYVKGAPTVDYTKR